MLHIVDIHFRNHDTEALTPIALFPYDNTADELDAAIPYDDEGHAQPSGSLTMTLEEAYAHVRMAAKVNLYMYRMKRYIYGIMMAEKQFPSPAVSIEVTHSWRISPRI